MLDPVKQLEKKFYELLASEETMQDFLNQDAFAGIWFWDLQHRHHIWLSKSLEKLLGFEEDRHLKIPISWNELLPIKDIDQICNSFDAYLEDGNNEKFEMNIPFIQKNKYTNYLKCSAIAVSQKKYLLGLVQIENRNIEYRSKEITAFPFINSNNPSLQNYPLQDLDISNLDEVEYASRYESLIKAGNLGGWEYRVDNKDLWCSKEYFELLGYPTDRIKSWEKYDVQKVWIDLLHPDDVENATAYFSQYLTHLKGIYKQTFRMKHANGHWVWISSKGKKMIEMVDGVKTEMVIGTHTDISESKRLENELFESNALVLQDNAHLKSIINSPEDIFIVSIDMNYCYTSYSDNYKQFTKEKFGKEIYIGFNILDLFNEKQKDIFKPALDKALRGEHVELNTIVPLESGDFTSVVNKYNPIQGADGTVIGATVFIHDTTREKLAEIERQINELRYASLFNGAADAILIANAQTGFIVDANKKAIELLGYEKIELIKLHQTQIHPPELFDEIAEKFKEFSENNGYYSVETYILTKEGSRVPVQISGGESFQIGEEIFVAAYFKDISTRVRITEENQKQNQQLKEIAWAQSHVIRAPLTRLMGLVNALDKGIVPDSEKAIYWKYLMDASNELDSVIKDITAKTIVNK